MVSDFCKECADFRTCAHNLEKCPYNPQEQKELETKAKENKRNYVADVTKRAHKPRTFAPSAEKQVLFNEIKAFLQAKYCGNVEILKENKLFTVKIGRKIFKIDIIEQRIK